MSLFEQRPPLVLQPHPFACQLLLSPRHRSPQTLLGIGHKAQSQFPSHQPFHQAFGVGEIPLASRRARLACLAPAVSLFFCLTAAAQERATTDVTLSYSFVRAKPATRNSTDFNMHGGNAEVALNPRTWFGVVGNFGGYHMDRFDSTIQTYLFGPRLYAPSHHRITPFAEGLFGLAHTTGGHLQPS